MNICQIQIQPVDNGYVIQAVSVDGENYNLKLVAPSEVELRAKVHEIADKLYVPREKPAKAVATT